MKFRNLLMKPALQISSDVAPGGSDAEPTLVAYFQPIVSARQKSIVGVEALARGVSPERGVIPPHDLFEMAPDAGARDRLQGACHERAIHSFGALGLRQSDLLLFLNLGMSQTETAATVVERLFDVVTAQGLKPGNVAIEILEAEVTDMVEFAALVRLLRSHGFLIVLDDVGAGHSNLDRVSFIRPDILKIDRSLIARVDVDFHKQSTLKSLVDLSRKIGALVIAEGVETESEAIVCLELGADLLQGYFLGRPQQASHLDVTSTVDRIERIALRFKSYMVGKINNRKLEHRRFNVIVNEILCDLNDGEVRDFDTILRQSIGRYPNVECVYVLDHSGAQVTDTVCHPDIRRRQDGVIFRPAPKGTDHSLKEYYYILLDVELHKYTTDPYVSLATGNVSRTLSTYFRDARNSRMFVLCIDVLSD